jgi:hypothetical protein
MRQRLSVAEHGDTMVLSGWSEALYYAGDELTGCGNEVAVNREIRRYGGPALLGQFNGPGYRAGRRDASWECMVLAMDELGPGVGGRRGLGWVVRWQADRLKAMRPPTRTRPGR